MLAFITKRITIACVILLMTTLLSYGLIFLAPGDPALLIVARRIGHMPSEAELETARVAYGLDQPLIVQYGNWLASMTRGDFGMSMRTGTPVISEVWRRGQVTLVLAWVSTCFMLIVGTTAGFLAVTRPDSLWDRLSRSIALISVSVPTFWLAFLLILVFSIELDWLPAFGMRGPASLVLPVLSLGLPSAASLSRLTRSVLLDVRAEDYLRTARAKGLSERTVWLRHALPNVAIPLITLVALQFGGIAAGSVIVETVFAWPGIGSYFVTAVESRDIPAIQASMLWFTTIVLGLHLVADVLSGVCDPRIRLR